MARKKEHLLLCYVVQCIMLRIISFVCSFSHLQEVCSQIWATLYDYPCLKSCDGIIKYVKECVRVAWGLVNQVSNTFVCRKENVKTFRYQYFG